MNQFLKLHLDNLARERRPVALVPVNASEGTIYIYDVISADWGVSARQVIDAIDAAAGLEVLNIRVNSPGGDVFEARAIIEAIKRFAGKTVAHIDALAASAATGISLAADEVVMSEGGLFMIHNASAMAWGDKHAMRKTADLLEKVEIALVADYTTKTGMPDAEIVAMMDAETWMTAQEALDQGFIDSIAKAAAKTSNTWNLAAFDKAPKLPEPAPDPAPTQSMTQANTNRLRLALL